VFGFSSVVVRLAALAVEHRNLADFPTGSLIGAVLSIPVAVWFIQQAHASGPPNVVVAALTLTDRWGDRHRIRGLGEGTKTSTIATLQRGVSASCSPPRASCCCPRSSMSRHRGTEPEEGRGKPREREESRLRGDEPSR